MALRPTKTEAKKFIAVIDEDYEDAREAAEAILLAAFELYEKKAKYSVVAQVKWGHAYEDQADVNDSRVCLGPFNTWAQAEKAGESIAIDSSGKAEARWMIIENFSGTPAAYYKGKAEEFKARMKDHLTPAEGFSAYMRERLLVVKDLEANVTDVWATEDSGAPALTPGASEVRLGTALTEINLALKEKRAPLLSESEAQAILQRIHDSPE